MEEIESIVRILDTDLDGKKDVQHALCGIRGVGMRTGRAIAQSAGINPTKKMGVLSDDEMKELRGTIERVEKKIPSWMLNRRKDFFTGEDKHILGPDLMMEEREDINMMKKIRSYNGIRHERGHRVRGQRTKSTGRKGAAIGVRRMKER
jgi:small subunit ribosomal protein S13